MKTVTLVCPGGRTCRPEPLCLCTEEQCWQELASSDPPSRTERSQHLSTTLKIDEETGTSEYPEMTFIIDLVDNVCAVYFAMEYFMRLTCSPKKIKFFFRIAIN